MDPAQSNLMLIKLLSVEIDKRLTRNANFIFNLFDGKRTVEMFAAEIISAVGNEKFTKMFDPPIKRLRGAKESKSEIRVVAIKPDVFISLLRFVYAGELELANLHSTYAAAQHYAMLDTCTALIKYADSQLSIENSTILLDQYCRIGGVFCNQKLGEVTSIINLHTFVAVHSNEFLKIDQYTLIRLLKSDQLFIQEKDLYFAVLRWINSELQRQDLEANLENKSKLFNEFKPLIRFPVMSKHQFFTATIKNDIFESNVCPAKSGLFSQAELDEFERYFETRDAKVLSIGYSVKERSPKKIGVLKLVQNKDQAEYQMLTGLDELYRKAEPRDACNGHLDTFCHIRGRESSCVGYSKAKPKPITAEEKQSDQVCRAYSIRVFRLVMETSPSRWNRGEFLQITKNGSLKSTFYKPYTIHDTFDYRENAKKFVCYDFWPTVELKKNNTYDFKFILPDKVQLDEVNKMKLENVYTTDESGERILDVKLQIIGDLAWTARPTFIYFLFK